MNKQDVIEFFDRAAPTWDAEMIKNDVIIEKILDNAEIEEGQDVLDVACGTGVMFPYYLQRGVASVTGIDISPEMAKIAEGKFSGDFTESTPYDPRSPYSASKASSDHMVRAWGHTFKLPVLLSNCSNNYGPYHFPEKLIPLIILNALDGKPLPIYGKGDNVRDWLYVEDHARALWLINRQGVPGETYNIGGNSERTNLEVVEECCRILDELVPKAESYSKQITFVSDRPGHDLRYAIDASKLKRELGWEPQITFSEGLRATVKWYLDNSWWWKPIREKNYAGERLGKGK